MNHAGRTILHVENDQDAPAAYWYKDDETGRHFDVRALPPQYFGPQRQAMLRGDRQAHRQVIIRAIDDDCPFIMFCRWILHPNDRREAWVERKAAC